MKKLLSILSLLLILPTAAFAVSTSTCFDSDSALMLHMNGANGSTTFTDSSVSPSTLTANGNAQISTAQSVFGGASGLFDGTGDFLSTTAASKFNILNNDFTIDFRIRFAAVTDAILLNQGSTGSNDLSFQAFYCTAATCGSSVMRWIWTTDGTAGTRTILSNAWTPSQDTWYHVTIVRNGSNLKVFVDGTQVGSTQTMNQTVYSSSATLEIADANSGTYLNGYLDEFRFVNGTAVWTSNFTSPSAAYVDCPKPGFFEVF